MLLPMVTSTKHKDRRYMDMTHTDSRAHTHSQHYSEHVPQHLAVTTPPIPRTCWRFFLISCLLLTFTSLSQARTIVEFWHAQGTMHAQIDAFAQAFNASQNEFEVVTRHLGDYATASIELVAALNSGRAPSLFDAEGTVFARLLEDEALADLSPWLETIPSELIDDIYSAQWEFGSSNGGRYGLPWNMSMPLLFYNATAFRQRNTEPPQTWAEFELAAERLTTRQTQGYINVSAAFIFETLVNAQGGRILDDDGLPLFTSPEAIEALTMLRRISDRGHSINRSFAEAEIALVDFVRTKGMMAFASQAFWTQGERYSVAFEPGAVPIPAEHPEARVPLIGAQLVVPAQASADAQRGAVAFWVFLMEPENVAAWVRRSHFLPARRAAMPLLEDWYAENSVRAAVLPQLERALLRPRIGNYVIWQGYLEEAIDRSLQGGMDPQQALTEAQRRAEAELP